MLTSTSRCFNMKEVFKDIPWDFRKERDVRTLVSFPPEIKENFPSVGVHHNGIDDCKFQIGYCVEIWRKLNQKIRCCNFHYFCL